jgi:hypothetical protein
LRLEFNEKIKNQRFISPFDLPDDIIFPVSQVISHIAPVTSFQSAQIADLRKFLVKESADKIGDHLRMTK